MQGIEPFDIVVIVLAIGMTVRGGLSGIASQIFSILSIVLSWYIAARHFDVLYAYIPQNNAWSKPVSIFVLFVLCNIAIRIASMVALRMVRVGPLKEFDRQLGALLGLLKGIVLCLVLTFFAVTLTEKSRAAVAESQSGKYLVSALLYVAEVIPSDERHAALRDEMAKFTAIVKDSGMKTTSLSEEVDTLKSKLNKSVIDPEASKGLAEQEKQAKAAAKALAKTLEKTPVTPSGNATKTKSATSSSAFGSLAAGLDQLFGSGSTSRNAAADSTSAARTSVNSAPVRSGYVNNGYVNSTSVNNNTAGTVAPVPYPELNPLPGSDSTQRVSHPLETLASNFSGMSGSFTFGGGQVSVNLPGTASGSAAPAPQSSRTQTVASGQYTTGGSTTTYPNSSGVTVSVPSGSADAQLPWTGTITFQPSYSSGNDAPPIGP